MNDLVVRFGERIDLHQSPYHANVMRKIDWQVDGDIGSQIYSRAVGPLTVAKFQRPKFIDPDRLAIFRKKTKP